MTTTLKHDEKTCECPLCVSLVREVVKVTQAETLVREAIGLLRRAAKKLGSAKTGPFTAGKTSWDPKAVAVELLKLSNGSKHEAGRLLDLLADLTEEA